MDFIKVSTLIDYLQNVTEENMELPVFLTEEDFSASGQEEGIVLSYVFSEIGSE